MVGTNFVKVHFSIANFSVCTKENSSLPSLNLDHISPSMVKGSKSLMVGVWMSMDHLYGLSGLIKNDLQRTLFCHGV